jgi:hypothetical protein
VAIATGTVKIPKVEETIVIGWVVLLSTAAAVNPEKVIGTFCMLAK